MERNLSARTRAVVAGRPEEEGQPTNVPIVPASALGLGYAREDGTPTWVALEEAVAALEAEGDSVSATAFASGLATVSAVLDLLPAGAEIAVPSDSYAGTRGVLDHAERMGRLRVRRITPVDTSAWVAAAASVDLFWLESPANPTLDLIDISAVVKAAAAQSHKPKVVVDNTFATPLGQQPLALGADIVVHSATKLIGGHSDLLLGLTVTADETLGAQLRDARTRGGATPGALEAWLALRGLRTLPIRYAEASRTAADLAARLDVHPAVTRVRYPKTGTMLAFELADAEKADRVCSALTLIRNATSLGGVESSIERRARLAGDSHVPAGLLRFSIGLEDPEDLWRDLVAALDSFA
ncbi:cystathionine gamma-synthase [Prauserella marina]|uniref:Cystathionine gamma-synthase n=1 Tax=Prauserella marina TaxID=530584 RepID=A0A1G6N8W5_9PSEU|nr:cystathionine gamma-synthase [Prauserella marina]SDC63696.1 cystathionine gamma-synthase [Prauserella marina]